MCPHLSINKGVDMDIFIKVAKGMEKFLESPFKKKKKRGRKRAVKKQSKRK